jgi:hypothetical protein
VNNLVIWFENLEDDPDRAASFGAVVPAKGMPEDWMNAIKGTASISRTQYIEPGVLSAVVVSLKESKDFEMFETVLRRVAQKVGTNSLVRLYDEAQYREYFESGKPILF